jgi:hypothetical protein
MRVVASFVVMAGVAAACGGAAETNLFDEVPSTAASSSASGGASTSGPGSSGGAASSGAASSGIGSSSSSGTCDPCPSSSSSSTSSSSSSSSSSGIVPFDAGPDIRPCNVNAPTSCRIDEYCHADGCALTGVCIVRPEQQALDLTPVCGCDHVTYWNSTIAAAHGANVAATGECGANATTCTRSSGCAGEGKCNLEQPLVCSLGDVKGTCWQLPKACIGTTGASVRRCNNQQCTSLCSAIVDERQFVPGTGCP